MNGVNRGALSLFRRLPLVIKIHGLIKPNGCKRTNQITGDVKYGQHLIPLLIGPSSQNIVYLLTGFKIMTNADTKPRIVIVLHEILDAF